MSATISEDTIDLVIETALWEACGLDVGALAAKTRAACARFEPALAGPAEITIILCDDASIAAHNKTWRGVNAPTNVLSFPVAAGPLRRGHLGDILLAFETIAREAEASGKIFSHHLTHLLAHGMLHLADHDHIVAEEAERMERLERDILYTIGIPDPYDIETSLAMPAPRKNQP